MRPIRCGNSRPTPYLRLRLPSVPLVGTARPLALDLGAGNLRNTRFAESLGWVVLPIDMAGDHGSLRLDLGHDRLPCADLAIGLFLCNYVMCFMDVRQRIHLISEIRRAACPRAHIFVEMYRARKGFPYDTRELARDLGWTVLEISGDRFHARRDPCSQ